MAHQDPDRPPVIVAANDGHRLDRLVTAIVLVATIGLILLSPLA